MSTRGLVGFVIDGEMKAAYRHSDSYPEVGGQDVINHLEVMRDRGWDKVKEDVEEITLLDPEGDIPEEVLELAKKMGLINTDVSKQSEEDLYCVLREAQGQLLTYLEVGFMPDDKGFLEDTLFCEYAYIVNLDTHKLQVYTGTTEPVVQFDLDDIPENWIEVIEKAGAEIS